MPPPSSHPTRFAIQKARGKGWKSLEVGEDRAQVEARFRLMIQVNPRAYFRMVQLDHNPEASSYDEMEFNWTLIELYDPTKGAVGRPPPRKSQPAPAATAARAGPGRKRGAGPEKVGIPLRVYLAVLVIGALAGFALLFLHAQRLPG